jgi:hypothetical protein
MSSPSKKNHAQQAGSLRKSKFGSYLSDTIYILTILGVLAFLYQSVGGSFFGN